MLKYQRLNREERDVIYMGHLHGATITSLAKRLGRCPSTIYRELKRNSCNNHYNPNGAHDAAQSRRSRNRPRLILNDTLQEYVVAKLKDGWSPESIAGRLNLDQAHKQVSAETIYAFIYSSEGQRQGLYRHLARKHVKRRFKFGRKKNRRSIIKDLVPIEQRPESVTK